VAKKPQQNPAELAKQASKLGELKIRLLFLVGALIVYRVGTFIPVPGVDPVALADFFEQQSGNLLGMFNMFSGGALSRFGIFALGIVPYISSSIIMQMASHIVPQLQQLRKEGEQGRRQIVKYTRYGTVALASFQSVAAASWLQNQVGLVVNPGPAFLITACITLVTGTVFLMWLGEQITERGIGNGISMIILAGIVSGLPAAIAGTAELVRNGEMAANRVRHLYGARTTAHHGELCPAPAGTKDVPGAEHALAVQDQHVGCHPADFCLEHPDVPGHDRAVFRPGGRTERRSACVADHWCKPRSRPACLRIAVRSNDYFLLLLLHGADVQLERHSGQPEEGGRLPAGYSARRSHRRVH
jgi:hypothetical protein